MNKFKLSLIAIATLVASNVNAQTYYSCIPEGCPAGQYFDGVKCLPLPATHTHTACPDGQYFDGVNCKALPTATTTCADGQYYDGANCKNLPKYCSEIEKKRLANPSDPLPLGWNCYLEGAGTNGNDRYYICVRTYLCN